MRTVEQFVKKVVTAGPGETLAAVAGLMAEHNVGTVVLVERGQPVGIVTDRDLALELGVGGVSPQLPVSEVMATPVETIAQSADVLEATELMRDFQVRRLVVVDEDGLVTGMVTVDDVLQLLARELANLAEGIWPEMRVC
jgi:CBS domain-containing protein